jgi:hypothetical protein
LGNKSNVKVAAAVCGTLIAQQAEAAYQTAFDTRGRGEKSPPFGCNASQLNRKTSTPPT